MIVGLLWVLVSLGLGIALIWRIDVRAKQYLQARELGERAALEERQASAALEAATAEERTEFERTRLLRLAAEERAAATVAEDPKLVEARVSEERAVVAARQRARVRDIDEHGIVEDDAARMAALQRGYQPYLARTHGSFALWLGDAQVGDLSVAALDRMIDSYLDYLQKTHGSFWAWFGQVDASQF